MLLELTDKVTTKKIYVQAAQIKFIEDAQSGGSHIVFGGDMGRIVAETKEQIFKMLSVFPIASPIQP